MSRYPVNTDFDSKLAAFKRQVGWGIAVWVVVLIGRPLVEQYKITGLELVHVDWIAKISRTKLVWNFHIRILFECAFFYEPTVVQSTEESRPRIHNPHNVVLGGVPTSALDQIFFAPLDPEGRKIGGLAQSILSRNLTVRGNYAFVSSVAVPDEISIAPAVPRENCA
ncbi:hypothetical protein [Paraburkholderia sp.]|uniref:hypothetical protein n=1 Tax=Paraburkholderia sp. TaxID=1926495 RepID=UPI003D6E1C51